MHFPSLWAGLLLGSSAGLLAQSLPPPELSAPVSLPVARQWARDQDPLLRQFATLDDAAAGQVEQAGLRPNPVVGAELENILGTGPLSGVDGMEITVGISQRLETAAKRRHRTTVAERERDLLQWQAAQRRAELDAAVSAAFVEVLLAQQTLDLDRELLDLASQSLRETERLVEAAQSSAVDRSRAALAVSRHRFALAQTERELAAARDGLASLWGMAPAPAFSVTGETSPPPPHALADLLALLDATAALGRFAAESAHREAQLTLEQARAHPDVEVSAGARYFNEAGGDGAFLVGASIPWPLHDRNQGNIRSARARLQAVDHEREAARRELLREVALAHREWTNAHAASETLANDLLPAARQTLADTEAGYQRGQFTLLAVLESRGALIEVRAAQLENLRRAHRAAARIEALTRPADLQP
ncbi:TolC family protein [Actomonas aquatica]|uniref:TolC family protein n=1 Tax=Actomonas aquatica TaxID=2866162 RepID=A0ABZ1CBZ0_9BACT|nr:TolC family protein [Opitutus sp. WL0086]WRQ88910.1 TolC family protein [Opitutus sp. WL0086]